MSAIDKSFFKAAYMDFVNFCKQQGLQVSHWSPKYMNNADGYFLDKKIVICKNIAETEYGLTVIAHEYGHYLQSLCKKYKLISDRIGSEEYSEKGYREIVKFEIDACIRARNLIFKRYGVLVRYDEFDDTILEKFYKPYWTEYYFIKPKKK